MALELARWNDDRLDDLKKTVDRMVPVFEGVAVLTAAVNQLESTTKKLAARVDAMVEEPERRKRNQRASVWVGVISAGVGGVVSTVGFILAGVIK